MDEAEGTIDVSAQVEELDPSLRLTPGEERQKQLALTFAEVKIWQKTAASCIVHVVQSYRVGDVDMQRALRDMHRIAVACPTQVRIWLLGVTSALLLRQTPLKKNLGQHAPPWPLWLQNATADLVLHQKKNNPGIPRSIYRHGRGPGPSRPSATSIALETLTKVGWFGDYGVPTPGTVDDWVRAREKDSTRPDSEQTL